MKYYKVEKVEVTTINGKSYNLPVADYGCGYDMNDVKLITRGYKANNMDDGSIIFTRSNSKFAFIAEEA